ncbi:hypothetical protein T492DRAFT_862403 [Pavlovales sp. CCMP2436]|nr:hypothetical protein T492DRAFT_862403 [Pavlovales sp. CCMP2436]
MRRQWWTEADEPRTAGKSSRRRGRIVVSDDDDDDTPSDQDLRKALAASDDDDDDTPSEAALVADEEDEEYGLEEVDSEDEAVMSDASSEGELASRRFKPSPNAARKFKEWTARTLLEKGGNLSSGRLMREPLTQRGTLPWHRTIPNPEFPQLGIKAVQQDNNDKSNENDDCSVHLGRHLELLLLCKNKRPAPDAPSVLENLQRDFNRIKNVPTLALLWLCCYFFVVLGVVTQPGMAAYFESHAFVFRWTRVQVGAGCGSDNNPLEGTNRTQKDALHWVRHSLEKFGEKMRNWPSGTRGWVKEKCRLDGTPVLLLPRERFSSRIDGLSVKAGAKLYSQTVERFLAVMGNDASTVIAAVNADLLIEDSHDLLDLLEAFAMLTVALYNKLEATLWRMMGVHSTLQGLQPLMKCSCGKYMPYLVCEHVIFWHMHCGQVTTPSTFKIVHHKKKGQKFGTNALGYPLHMRKILKGAALSSAY